MKHLNITVLGQVQGVSFRYEAKIQADNLNITGFAKNLADGSVYIEAEGQEENLAKFIKWCKQGSPFSQVSSLKMADGQLKHFHNFDIY